MKVFVPDGWKMSVLTDWQRCSSASIAFGIVTLSSPDGNAEIVLTTPEAYFWSASRMTYQQGFIPINNKGCNFAKRQFHFPYQNARDYIKQMLSAWGMSVLSTHEVDLRKEDRNLKKRFLPFLAKGANAGLSGLIAASRGVSTPVWLQHMRTWMGFR